MRIAVITETYPPEINGVALTVRGFVEHLEPLGHAVDVVRPRQPDAGGMPGSDGDILVAGAGIPRYPGLRFGLPSARRLRASWRQRRPDAAYIATEGPLGWSALGVARALGIPVATGFHTRFDDYLAYYGAGLLAPAVTAWLRGFHNRAQATVVPTRELRDDLVARGFHDVRVLSRGVDTCLFDPARRDDDLRTAWSVGREGLAVGHVGRIAPEKNLGLALRAFDAIAAAVPGARMVWIGDGPARARLERDHCGHVFAGQRCGEDLGRHFASLDLFLFPSLTETFGNVTLEAMASGVPTLAFDYGAAREHLVDGAHGRTVDKTDAAAFVNAAVALAGDTATRKRMGLAARSAVVGLTRESAAHALAHLLDGLRGRSAA
ncbi:MAG: glycosyltransferase family 4 protein [Pseudomonadota bacterium]